VRNTKAFFDYIYDEVVYGSGGDGEAYIFLKESSAEEMAADFLSYLRYNNKVFGATLTEREGHYFVWDNQEGWVFTNRKYVEDAYPYADLIVKMY
jgi:hypothetical protein